MLKLDERRGDGRRGAERGREERGRSERGREERREKRHSDMTRRRNAVVVSKMQVAVSAMMVVLGTRRWHDREF